MFFIFFLKNIYINQTCIFFSYFLKKKIYEFIVSNFFRKKKIKHIFCIFIVLFIFQNCNKIGTMFFNWTIK